MLGHLVPNAMQGGPRLRPFNLAGWLRRIWASFFKL